MIKWLMLVNSVHKTLIENKVNLADARVGDFEFGGLELTENVKSNINKDTGAIVIVDARTFIGTDKPSTHGAKPTITWVEFVNHIEQKCLSNGILPSDVAIDHLEIRPNDINALSIFVDKKFKTLSITDREGRINGSKLSDLINP
jgi:hypothetical protein